MLNQLLINANLNKSTSNLIDRSNINEYIEGVFTKLIGISEDTQSLISHIITNTKSQVLLHNFSIAKITEELNNQVYKELLRYTYR